MSKKNIESFETMGTCPYCGRATRSGDKFKCPNDCASKLPSPCGETSQFDTSKYRPGGMMPQGMSVPLNNIMSPAEFMQAMFARMDEIEKKIDAVLANQNQQGMHKEPPCKKGTKKCTKQ